MKTHLKSCHKLDCTRVWAEFSLVVAFSFRGALRGEKRFLAKGGWRMLIMSNLSSRCLFAREKWSGETRVTSIEISEILFFFSLFFYTRNDLCNLDIEDHPFPGVGGNRASGFLIKKQLNISGYHYGVIKFQNNGEWNKTFLSLFANISCKSLTDSFLTNLVSKVF